MVNSFADWLCNVLVWSAVIALSVLLYEVFGARGFLASAATPMAGLAALAAVVVLSALWPKYSPPRRADARKLRRPGPRLRLPPAAEPSRCAGQCFHAALHEIELE
jgi:hypothetical protein